MTAFSKRRNQICCCFEKALESKSWIYKRSFGKSQTFFSNYLGLILEKRIWFSHSCQGLMVIMCETAPKSPRFCLVLVSCNSGPIEIYVIAIVKFNNSLFKIFSRLIRELVWILANWSSKFVMWGNLVYFDISHYATESELVITNK